ncbi:hypothetical protein RhiirA4_492678 [Rhizophagus irregularis]|uniref:Uncharacterized protein n=1 Tax=Rhizophagus irregularis TaxID=588596 RepID=A0A2I1HXD3_9GLOM|nr:hypothetical protein RhiirA4_492678 [Rhizophagus irregularis]
MRLIYCRKKSYNKPFSATETYEEKYVRPLLNEGDIYVGSPWETGKIYVLEHLTTVSP